MHLLKKIAPLVIALSPAFLLSVPASAQLDAATQDLLIKKLSRVRTSLPENEPAKVGVSLRLADLYAERARLQSIKEIEAGCSVCVAGAEDRKSALMLYQEYFGQAAKESQPRILIQIGHLQEMDGKTDLAEKSYQSVLKDQVDGETRADAALSLAEIYFKQQRYPLARQFYSAALAEPKAKSRGYAAYRLAWSIFNLGETEAAATQLFTILKDPTLLAKNDSTGGVNVQFQEEVSRDLATFLAKKSVKADEIEQLYVLSPESTKLSNLMILASESTQVGRKAEALVVWKIIEGKTINAQLKLGAKASQAALKFDLADQEGSVQSMQELAAMWTGVGGCQSDECKDIQKTLRPVIVSWNKTETKKPTEMLSRAYSSYLKIFPQDAEMAVWGAEVARTLGQWDLMLDRYELAAVAQKANPDKQENILLMAIEGAEGSKQDISLLRAQNFYLATTPTHTKEFEIRYQMARKQYDDGKLKEAAEQMHELALQKKGPQKLRGQAADLALDALVLLKDDSEIGPWAGEFAAQFPEQAGSYQVIVQKALLTESARVAEGDSQKAWTILQKFDPAAASEADRKIALKNKLILAEKLGLYSEALKAANAILSLKNIKPEDHEFALSRKAWFSELQLDFASAFEATRQMKMADVGHDARALRLALYSDLAGKESATYYKQFIKESKDEKASAVVAAELVRRSANPWREIENQKQTLKKTPEVTAALIGEIYEKNPQQKSLRAALDSFSPKSNRDPLLKKYDGLLLLADLEQIKNKLAQSHLDSKTQGKLNRTIRERDQLLRQLDGLAAQAIQLGEWSPQVVALNLVAKESARFHEELLSLPVPEGLSEAEQGEYMNLLSQQANPFKEKAAQALAKSNEFWTQPQWQEGLNQAAQRNGSQKAFQFEVEALAGVAPEQYQTYFQGLKQTEQKMRQPAQETIEQARAQVQLHPMDPGAIQNLLSLEKESGNFAMTQFLEARLKTINEKGAQ